MEIERDDETQYAQPPFYQRTAVWCEAAEDMRRIPFRVALLKLPVGGDGCARYCATVCWDRMRPRMR